MLPSRRVCLNDLNPHLLCVLCGGYFIDATTIIECLHSFCRTCIVRYLETSKYCPICDVQVHKTRPLQNIRSDQTLQDIVYKLVPGLFQGEMRLRREFYSLHSESVPTGKEDAGEVTDTCYIYSGDELVSLSLQYAPSGTGLDTKMEEAGRRYLRCPAAVTVAHLQKLLRAKHGLSGEHRVDICHEAAGQPLSDNFSLMDVAYIHQWKRKGPMLFYYQIFERPCKRRKLEEDGTSAVSALDLLPPVFAEGKDAVKPVETIIPDESGEEWKEVQLQISEAGIMKVTNLAAPTVVASETVISSGRVDNPSPPKEEDITKAQAKTDDSQNTKQQKSDINGNKEIEKLPVSKSIQVPTSSSIITSHSQVIPAIAKKHVESKPEHIKIYSPQVTPNTPVTPLKSKEKPIKPFLSVDKEHKKDSTPNKPVSACPAVKKPSSGTIGYKTLKFSPKSWNPSVSRGSYIGSHSTTSKSSTVAQKSDGDAAETSRASSVPIQNKPPRFFKERDRPRFLGNPVSGVKPMYQIQSDNRPSSTAAPSSSMIKIDPKTLSPMSSKVSVSTPNNNNNHLSCNSITTGTGTITTTVASHRSTQSLRNPINSVPSLSSVLHPPPNPLLYSYQSLMSSPLIRPPIMNPNLPHPYPPYPLPQSMFYGSQQPRFQPSPPAVQRIPSNLHAQKSPSVPVSVTSSLPNNYPITPASTSTSSLHSPKEEVPKVNGEVGEKPPTKKESFDSLAKVAKPPKDIIPPPLHNGFADAKKLSNGPINTPDTSTANKMVTSKVKPVDNGRITPQPETSKNVPPIAPAQASK